MNREMRLAKKRKSFNKSLNNQRYYLLKALNYLILHTVYFAAYLVQVFLFGFLFLVGCLRLFSLLPAHFWAHFFVKKHMKRILKNLIRL